MAKSKLPEGVLSNSPEDAVGFDQYPGGEGVIESIKFDFHKYKNAKDPKKMFGVVADFHPTDGSNGGKPAELFWSHGNVEKYYPHVSGGFACARDESVNPPRTNWMAAVDEFIKCGLDVDRIQGVEDGKEGILALIGTECRLTLVDQPERDFGDAREEKRIKPKMYVPTFAKFPWEQGDSSKAKRKSAAASDEEEEAPKRRRSAKADEEEEVEEKKPSRKSKSTSGAEEISPDSADILADTIAVLLAENSGTVEIEELPKLVTKKLEALGTALKRSKRLSALQEAEDPKVLKDIAKEREWEYDAKEGTISEAE